MKGIVVVGGFAVVVVAGLALYANTVLNEARRRTTELEAEHAECAVALRRLDERFPYRGRDTLDPERYARYLGIRAAVAPNYVAPEGDDNRFSQLTRRNESLRILARELEGHAMGLAEYRAITRRWQSVLARGEHPQLLRAWNEVAGLRGALLPQPARNATVAERSLLATHAREIEAGLAADVLGSELDAIAGEG